MYIIPFDTDILDAIEFITTIDVCTRFVELPFLIFGLGGYQYKQLIYDRATGLITLDGEDITYLKEYLQ